MNSCVYRRSLLLMHTVGALSAEIFCCAAVHDTLRSVSCSYARHKYTQWVWESRAPCRATSLSVTRLSFFYTALSSSRVVEEWSQIYKSTHLYCPMKRAAPSPSTSETWWPLPSLYLTYLILRSLLTFSQTLTPFIVTSQVVLDLLALQFFLSIIHSVVVFWKFGANFIVSSSFRLGLEGTAQFCDIWLSRVRRVPNRHKHNWSIWKFVVCNLSFFSS